MDRWTEFDENAPAKSRTHQGNTDCTMPDSPLNRLAANAAKAEDNPFVPGQILGQIPGELRSGWRPNPPNRP